MFQTLRWLCFKIRVLEVAVLSNKGGGLCLIASNGYAQVIIGEQASQAHTGKVNELTSWRLLGHENFWKGMWVFPKIGVPLKWMVYNGKPYENGWFGGTTIFGNIHVKNKISKKNKKEVSHHLCWSGLWNFSEKYRILKLFDIGLLRYIFQSGTCSNLGPVNEKKKQWHVHVHKIWRWII